MKNQDIINYKGLVIYSYRQGRNDRRLCVADPNHNYPYEAKGVTLASGFRCEAEARKWVDSRAA